MLAAEALRKFAALWYHLGCARRAERSPWFSTNREHFTPMTSNRSTYAAATACSATVTVDFDRVIGSVKPVNGVGQPPMLGFGGDSLFHYLTEAGVPFSRLHDVGGAFGKNVYVDIPNIFRDFAADENDPANYDFTFTDDLMVKLDKAGVRPYFRLGVTIENAARIKAYRVFPPKDYAKWARVCEHVMAHYVEGWSDGPRVEVSHWEIWNEPDDYPDRQDSMMWRAPFKEYVRFYTIAAKHLKARFPNERIGGYGSNGVYLHPKATGERLARVNFRKECTESFFEIVARERAPLDFFSFHSYVGVADTMRNAVFVRECAERNGFTGLELSLNEWLPNPAHEKLGTAQQAAEIAAEMIGFQNGTVDSACIYDARCGIGDYSPLFNPLTYKPHKAYWAFMAFNELRQAGTAVNASSSAPGVWVAAAKGEVGGVVMIANPDGEARPIAIDADNAQVASCRITDETRTWEETPLPDVLPPYAVLVVRLRT